MTGRLVRALARALDSAAALLPADRRHWAEALQAETGQVPAGWPRLTWLTGGLWLIAKETGMARRIGYWTGAAAVMAAVAWVVWLSWQTAPPADPESVTDRVRVLVGAAALAGLPWVARRRGLFGPVANSIVPRLVRILGCAAICGMGVAIVHIDRHGGVHGVVGTGGFSWVREACGLIILIAAVAVPLALKARRPQTEPEVLAFVAVVGGVIALVVVPIQAFVVGFAVLVLAATSRRSPIAPATWVIALIASLPMAAAALTLPFIFGNLYSAIFVVALIALALGVAAGASAARQVPGTGHPDGMRSARIRQGALAGAAAGAIGGLAATSVSLILGEMVVVGILAGLMGGVIGGSAVANRRDRCVAARLTVSGAPVPTE